MKWLFFCVLAVAGASAGYYLRACEDDPAPPHVAEEKTPGVITSTTKPIAKPAAPKPTLDSVLFASLESGKKQFSRRWEPSEGAQKRLAYAQKIKSPGAPIEDICLQRRAGHCIKSALSAFYNDLDALDQKTRQKDVVITALGNSLIAADGIVGTVRKRFQERFEDGGRGLLYADRISDYGRRDRCGIAPPEHWKAFNLGMGAFGRYPYGLSAMQHVSQRRGARTRYKVEGPSQATLFSYDHERAPGIELSVPQEGGTPLKAVSETRGSGGLTMTHLDIPEGTHWLTLKAQGRNAVVQGLVLDDEKHGVVLDTVGIPAIDAHRFMRSDEELFAQQLKARAPSLTMIMLGGVENRRVSWGKYPFTDVDEKLRALIDRVKTHNPQGSCLVVGPIDATYGPLDEKVFKRPFTRYRPREELFITNRLQRAIAYEKGCAYYDQLAAMGGSGTLKRWDKLGLMWTDLVHPRTKGLRLLGDLLADALRQDYLNASKTTLADAKSVAPFSSLTLVGAQKVVLEKATLAAARNELWVEGKTPLEQGFASVMQQRPQHNTSSLFALSERGLCFHKSEDCVQVGGDQNLAALFADTRTPRVKGALLAMALANELRAHEKDVTAKREQWRTSIYAKSKYR